MAGKIVAGAPEAPEQGSLVSDEMVDAVLALANGDARETVRLLLRERASLLRLVSHGYVRGQFAKGPQAQ
jgi:hypothetical protein